MIKNLMSKLQALATRVHRAMTRMPGAVTFHNLYSPFVLPQATRELVKPVWPNRLMHGYIWIKSYRGQELGHTLKIGFTCENPRSVFKNLPYVHEEIVRQAREQGYEPSYLQCIGPHNEKFERSIDSLFAL